MRSVLHKMGKHGKGTCSIYKKKNKFFFIVAVFVAATVVVVVVVYDKIRR